MNDGLSNGRDGFNNGPTAAPRARWRIPALLLTLAAAVPLLCSCAVSAAAARTPRLLKGYSGARWPVDFQVRAGHCDRAAISTGDRGEAAMAPLGERAPLNRGAAVLIGAQVTDLLAPRLDSEPDEGDRACMGEVLELGVPGRGVSWDNPTTGVHYAMRPDGGHEGIGGACRGFTLRASGNDTHSRRRALACVKGPGLWQLSGL